MTGSPNPRPLARRDALGLGLAGLVGVVIGGVGLSRTGLPWDRRLSGAGPVAGAGLRDPPVLQSRNGLLQVELVAARSEVILAGLPARALAYNGSVPGSTWLVRPGDRIEVQLVNRLSAPTNLHAHGLAVSPQGNGDNPFVSVEPGAGFAYRFDVPGDHPSGVFWYHPHLHGHVADQVFGGLYGVIIIEDSDVVPVARERVLVVADTTLEPDGEVAAPSAPQVMLGREGDLLMINGQLVPTLTARPGERERWRVVNACTSRYLRLALPGQRLQLLGMDSGHERAPRDVEDLLLPPGNRADLLVTLSAGKTDLVTLGHDRGAPMASMTGSAGLSGPASLARVTVSGSEATASEPLGERPVDADLRGRPVDRRREISFSMGMGGMRGPGAMGGMMAVGFDGRAFDPSRTDQRVAAGTLEEWTITNPTPMDHPFHLHVWPMQLVEVDGSTVVPPTWRDVVNVPAGGRVRVLVNYARHPGRSVYHCHILDHEDAGMMATVDVR